MHKNISLSQENINYLRYAFAHFFPEDTIYSADKPFVSGEFNWKNRGDFIDFVYRLTGIKIKNEKDFINIKKAQLEIENLVSESTQEKTTESNLPDKEARELQEAERQKRETEIAESKIKAEREVEASIKRSQELYSKQAEYHKIREILSGKKIIVSPKSDFTEVSLTPQEKDKIFNLAQAIKVDPATVQRIIEQKIQESVDKSSADVGQNINQTIIEHVSKDLINKISAFAGYEKPDEIPDKLIVYNQASPFAAISDFDDKKLQEIIPDNQARIELTHNARAVAISFESDNNLGLALTQPLFEDSENITFLFYPTKIAEFQISDNQNDQKTRDEGMEIDITDVYDQGKQIWDTWNKISNNEIAINEAFAASPRITTSITPIRTLETAKLARLSFPKTMGVIVGLRATNTFAIASLSSKALMIPGQQVTQMIIGGGAAQLARTSSTMFGTITSFVVNPTTLGTKTAFFAGKGVTMGGQKMLGAGLAVGKSKLAIAISSKGISVAATGVFSKILGFFTGPIGFIVTTISAWLLSKVDWSKVKKAAPYIVGGVLGIGAFAIAGPTIGIIVGVTALGATSLAAGGTAGLSVAVSGVGSFFGAIGSAIGVAIGTPILIIFLVIPILVALILFIINSGAYVVPLSESTFGRTSNPYIDVIKTPEPPGPFTNKELPKTITYKITIRAKRSVLTNVSIKYDCKVISAANKNCPQTSDAPTAVDSISPSLPYTFTYTSTYDDNYMNSAIIDTVTITADTGEETGTTTETSASVTFGTPPISCPVPAAVPLNQNNFSYNSATNTGHGSTSYWRMMGGTPYRYALPQWTGCNTPADCSYYGYAYDVFPSGINTVYAPTILGKEVVWNLSGTGFNGAAGFTLIYKDSAGLYSLVLTHVSSTIAPKTVTSGQKITTLFNQGSNTHLHIEFQMNGRWVKPENYFCK